MNCRVTQKLLQLYLDHSLDDAEARAVERHVSGCGLCRGHFLDLERLALALEGLPRTSAPPGLLASVMGEVLSESRGRRDAIGRWTRTLPAAVAACLGLVFAVQPALDLMGAFPEIVADTPSALVESLLVVATSIELPLIVGAGLLFLSAFLAVVQLLPKDEAASLA